MAPPRRTALERRAGAWAPVVRVVAHGDPLRYPRLVRVSCRELLRALLLARQRAARADYRHALLIWHLRWPHLQTPEPLPDRPAILDAE